MAFPFGKTVTIVRTPAQTLPTFGDVTGDPLEIDVAGCAVWPVSTAELIAGQDTVTWDLNCSFPSGTEVLSSDQVEVDSLLYDVVGQPQSWDDSPLSSLRPGVLVQLKAGTG